MTHSSKELYNCDHCERKIPENEFLKYVKAGLSYYFCSDDCAVAWINYNRKVRTVF